MGIAFYFKNKNNFVPDSYILNINNISVVSRFDNTVPDNRNVAISRSVLPPGDEHMDALIGEDD